MGAGRNCTIFDVLRVKAYKIHHEYGTETDFALDLRFEAQKSTKTIFQIILCQTMSSSILPTVLPATVLQSCGIDSFLHRLLNGKSSRGTRGRSTIKQV